jgi:hypothetical protein
MAFESSDLLSPTVVAVGWYIVARQADLRERRKDTRDLIKDFEEKLRDALVYWVEYYSNLPTSIESIRSAAQIKATLEEIPVMISRIETAGLVLNVDDEIVALRKWLMGYDFESLARDSATIDQERYTFSCMSISNIIAVSERAYFETYPVKRVQFINWDLFFSALKK